MKISVALCTYNGERFIAEQLNSFVEQTLKPDEIVLCDDGSTDNTLQIAEDFQKHSGITTHIYRNPTQLGFVKNFEKAISLCKGDLIALSDQDDVWLPEKLEEISRQFTKPENSHISMVFGDLVLVDDELNPLGKTMWEALNFNEKLRQECLTKGFLWVLKRTSYVTGASVVIKKELFKKASPFLIESPLWYHDGQLGVIAARDNELMLIEKPYVLYRQHGRQQIGTKFVEPNRRLSETLTIVADKKRSDLVFFDKAGVWLPGERKRTIREIKHLEKRLRTLKKPFFKKIFPVMSELLNFNYMRFYGKDFFLQAVSEFFND